MSLHPKFFDPDPLLLPRRRRARRDRAADRRFGVGGRLARLCRARAGAAGPERVNPEKGGTDTSYHAVGLLFAATYYTLLADEPLRAAMRPMADRGLAWLMVRVRPDGTVDQTGNTRIGFDQERGPLGNFVEAHRDARAIMGTRLDCVIGQLRAQHRL